MAWTSPARTRPTRYPTPSPTASASPGADHGTPGRRSPTTTSAPPAAPAYPATARAYAEAVLAAWKQKLINKLGDLTTALVQDQIISIPGPPNQTWTYQRCDGAAGSSYCAFVNADGDVITLRISTALLGKAHAATEVKLDQTEYSSDAKQYVQAFVEAWRNGNTKRMLALSADQSVVDFFTHYTPPETYQVCSRLVGSVWRVRIYNNATGSTTACSSPTPPGASRTPSPARPSASSRQSAADPPPPPPPLTPPPPAAPTSVDQGRMPVIRDQLAGVCP